MLRLVKASWKKDTREHKEYKDTMVRDNHRGSYTFQNANEGTKGTYAFPNWLHYPQQIIQISKP